MTTCIPNENCICKQYTSAPKECRGDLQIEEKGKKVKISLKSDEKALFAIIDNCIITDNGTKTDAICLFQGSKKYSFLLELKGFGDIEKAFNQLSYTKNNRGEYKEIIECFKNLDNRKVNEKFVIVTNRLLNAYEREKFEKNYQIRVSVLFSKDTTTIPDLKDYQ